MDELQSEFIIFPVPAEDVVNLTMTNGTAAYQLELRDLQGRIVKSSMISTESSTVSFDLTDYDAGMYIIKIFNEDEEGYFKVLKK
ncbi:MAG: T9SS type A sorting domain-containing protein [Flavobacteriales bacterium]|nr:T9SS type A sorting domain-containing protein [Flavobacteriales bacterium]